MSKKQRLDILLVERGLAETRSKAKAMVENGLVTAVCGGKLLKPGQEIPNYIELEIAESEKWVSRAALKLNFALNYWNINVTDKTCLDIGASTGGFTEVLLKNGATKIYAVDVGHGQFHPGLQIDNKIILLEKTNSRNLDNKLIPEPIDLIVCDVSFISLQKALPPALELGNTLVALIKPQFEVGRAHIGKGIVKDEKLHALVCNNIKNWLETSGWKVKGLEPSPITGGDGNKEFLIYAEKSK